MIRNMFADDINRNIGGVVRVDQDDTHTLRIIPHGGATSRKGRKKNVL